MMEIKPLIKNKNVKNIQFRTPPRKNETSLRIKLLNNFILDLYISKNKLFVSPAGVNLFDPFNVVPCSLSSGNNNANNVSDDKSDDGFFQRLVEFIKAYDGDDGLVLPSGAFLYESEKLNAVNVLCEAIDVCIKEN